MTVEGEYVSFVDIERLPRGAKKVGEVPENDHVFFKTRDGKLFMRNCSGDLFEINGDLKLSHQVISDDYEAAPDPWGEAGYCSPDNDGPQRRVRVQSHLRRRVVDHLENPPSSCLCHRSKTVDRARRGLIRRLK